MHRLILSRYLSQNMHEIYLVHNANLDLSEKVLVKENTIQTLKIDNKGTENVRLSIKHFEL